MEKFTLSILSSIFALILLVPGSVLNSSAACVTYSSTTKTITVSCATATHLTEISNGVNNPNILSKTSGVWTLAANLVVAKGGSAVIDSTDGTWVKIVSDGTTAYGLKNSGTLKIDSIKISSWNPASNTYASAGSSGATPRAYIAAQGGASGKMDISNSEIAYLGYTGTGHHGLDYYGSDGSSIKNNNIHHNWRAFYSSGVGGITIDHNDVHDNLEYGIDPHSGTHDMYLTYNKSYNNNHGIICSQMCYNMHIENNELYANNRDGIYLDAGSHHSTIKNNNIHEEDTGIQLPSLSYSEVSGNTITNTKYGIKLYTQIGSSYDTSGGCGTIGCGSSNNNIHDNDITASSTGIEVRDGAATNTISSNTLSGASTGRAIVVEGSTTSGNLFKDNHIKSTAYGMKLTSSNTDSKFVGNYFDAVATSGEYTVDSASALKLENTAFSSDVIKAIDTTSNPVSISNSGVISVTDGATGKVTTYDTSNQPYSTTLANNAKITVTTKSGTPSDTTAPAQVTGLSVTTQSSTQLNLAWTANSESDLNHYNIYRGTSSGFSVTPGTTPPTGTSNANSYQSTGLNPSTTYYYKVAAVDNAGNIGPLSSEDSATTGSNSGSTDTTAPKQVTGLTVKVVSGSQLKLSWSQNKEKDLDHYLIYRGSSSGFNVNPGSTAPVGTATSNSYTDSGLNPSTKYYYKVAAVDHSGNIGSVSSTKSGTTSGGGSSSNSKGPGKVSGLSVKAVSNNQLDLKWNKPKGSDIDHYNIYKSQSSQFTVKADVSNPSGTSATNSYSSTSLNPSTKYYYKVAAVDHSGNIGPVSKAKSGTTSGGGSSSNSKGPGKVSGLSVKAVSNNELDLKWDKPKGSDIDHYNIYKSKSSKFTVKAGVTDPSGTSTTNSYHSTNLNPSTKYYYKVAAVDHSGKIGSLSSSKSGTTKSASSSSNVKGVSQPVQAFTPSSTTKAETIESIPNADHSSSDSGAQPLLAPVGNDPGH